LAIKTSLPACPSYLTERLKNKNHSASFLYLDEIAVSALAQFLRCLSQEVQPNFVGLMVTSKYMYFAKICLQKIKVTRDNFSPEFILTDLAKNLSLRKFVFQIYRLQ
jgi:hypothetical protein